MNGLMRLMEKRDIPESIGSNFFTPGEMSLQERIKSLKMKAKPGSQWRRRVYPDRKALVLEVGVSSKSLDTFVIYRYGPSYEFTWISEPKEFFSHYDPIE